MKACRCNRHSFSFGRDSTMLACGIVAGRLRILMGRAVEARRSANGKTPSLRLRLRLAPSCARGVLFGSCSAFVRFLFGRCSVFVRVNSHPGFSPLEGLHG